MSTPSVPKYMIEQWNKEPTIEDRILWYQMAIAFDLPDKDKYCVKVVVPGGTERVKLTRGNKL